MFMLSAIASVQQTAVKLDVDCRYPSQVMLFSELLPTVSQLSHQDKLRLIHFLLLAVAEEDGCRLEPAQESSEENSLLHQLSSTEAVVWSPQADSEAVQALSNLLVAAQEYDRALMGNYRNSSKFEGRSCLID
ncbi:hypothetical protein WB391_01685 [Lusitaniella coriacea LEGE 07167]